MSGSLATMFRALRHPAYRRWAVADFVSVTGAWMQNLGLNWLVLTGTGSAGLLGVSLVCQTLPGMLLASWAGAVADRVPARRILVVTQSLHALLALGLAAVAAGHAPLAAVYALAVGSGIVTAFDGPALGRFGAQLVGREDLSNALGLGSILSSGGRILGMSLAGALVGVTGEPALFLLNAASFAGVLAVIARIRPRELHELARSGPERSGAAAGVRYVLGHRPMVALFALSFVLSSLGRNYQITMAAMSSGPLGAGAAGYGALSVVFAVGTIVGGFLSALLRRLTLKLLLGMALLTSVLQMVSGAAPGLVWFALVLLPIAAGAVVLDTAVSTRVQLDSAEDMRGRVLSAKSLVTAASGAAGGTALGWLSQFAGPAHALVLAGAITTAATLAAWAWLARMPQRRAMPAEARWARLAVEHDPAEPALREVIRAPGRSAQERPAAQPT